MPELPEVETVRRGLAPVMVGATIEQVEQRRPDLRFPFPARFVEQLEGRRIAALDRRAKYLQCRLDDGSVLVMHLGMSGSFRIERDGVILSRAAGEGDHPKDGGGGHRRSKLREVGRRSGETITGTEPAPPPPPTAVPLPRFAGEDMPGVFHHPRAPAGPHDHVAFHLSNGTRIVYNDPRRFGFMQLVAADALEAHPFFARLGIEPLSDALDGAALARRFACKAAPLKAALLDQTLIAGLGNIYVCEALHRAGLSPRRAAGTLVKRDGTPTKRAVTLAWVIKEVLLEAVAAGGSSLRDHRQADGTLGYFQHSFRVYDREGEPCPKLSCSGVVTRIVQSGRSTFFCPVCQR